MTPDLQFQNAVKAALTTALDGLITPDSIRVGTIRPKNFPAVVLGLPNIQISGYASGGQIVAEASMLLHLWFDADASATAQQAGAAVLRALMDAPKAEDISVDSWEPPRIFWRQDDRAERSVLHGAVDLNAVLRWRS